MSKTDAGAGRNGPAEEGAASTTPLVEVLLATYNGERFLREQIESILAQDYPALRVVARDDGSADGTRAILEEYEMRDPRRFRVLAPGEPTGSAKGNFMRLLRASSAEYVCLADQDDLWKPDKVSKGMERMRSLESRNAGALPLLVFSDLEVVDDGLHMLQASFWRHQRINPANIHRFARLLTQNVVTGCTVMTNRPLAQLAVTMPAEAFMHDWWIALMACAYGDADFLREPTVLYRQHGGNLVGAAEHQRRRLVPRWRYHDRRREQWEQGERQAEAMLRDHREGLPPKVVETLEAYVRCEQSRSRWVRVLTMLRRGFFQVGVRSNLAIAWYLFDMKAAKRSDVRSDRDLAMPVKS